MLDASHADEGEPPRPPVVYLAPSELGVATASDSRVANAFHADPFGLLSALAVITDSPVDYDTCHDLKTLIEALPVGAGGAPGLPRG